MEISIYREREKTVVIIEANFTVTTYQFYNTELSEIAEFIKVITKEN